MHPSTDRELERLLREDLEAEVRRLRTQSASLAQMFEQAPSFIALLGGPEHRFTLTNAAYQQVINGRDVVGRTVAEALPDARRVRTQARVVDEVRDALAALYHAGRRDPGGSGGMIQPPEGTMGAFELDAVQAGIGRFGPMLRILSSMGQ